MSKATVTYKEIRFTGLDTELTHCFVLLEAGGDCPIGVQGWHYKAFPPSKSVGEIIESLPSDDPILWPQMAPPID
jgi:hypothetical protein